MSNKSKIQKTKSKMRKINNNGISTVNEPAKIYESDLNDRLIDFAVNSLKFISTIPHKREYDVIKYQLSKSSTSIGANYEEAQS